MPTHHGSTSTGFMRVIAIKARQWGKIWRFPAVAAILMFGTRDALAQSLNWDSSGASPAGAFDGSGNWDTSTDPSLGLWTDGVSSLPWTNGSSAVIGNNNGTAGTITIVESGISAGGITFNAPGSGNYTIAASGANTLTLSGAAAINVATDLSPTISAPIAGTAGLNLAGPGTLNLTGNNTFTGTIAINSGALVAGSSGSFGASTNAVTLGTPNVAPAAGDPVGALTISSGVTATIGSFKSATNNSAGTNSLVINSGATLNVNSTLDGTGVNGAFVVGAPTGTVPLVTNLTISGAGSLNVTGGVSNSSFVVGLSNNNTSTALMNPTLNMSGLSSFSFTTGTAPVGGPNGGNEFIVGVGCNAAATASLAVNSTIVAGTIDVGDNGIVTPGLGGAIGPNNSSNTNTLNLGSGANVFNANTILIGGGRTLAKVLWATGVNTGTLTITGAAGGASTANITVGTLSAGTPASTASSLDMSGHSVTVQAGTVIVGNMAGGSGGNANSTGRGGSITFDTGTFNVQNLQLAVGTSGSSPSIAGVFTLGSSSNSTGILSVTNQFLIGNNTGANNSAARGTFNVKGGTANIGANIIDVSTNTAGSVSTLALTGGTLNMQGFAIGPILAAGNTGAVGLRNIGTVTFPSLGNSAVLMNLGGTGVNDAGLTMNGTGILVLEGNSTYSGSTTINAGGTIQVGQASDVLPPATALKPAVTDNGTLAFGSSQLLTISSVISGSGGVNQTGTGTTTVTSVNSYSGPNSLVAGVLRVATLGNAGGGGTNSLLGAGSNAASNIVLTGGTLQYAGSGESTDRLFSITPTGGGIDSSGTGPINFNNGGAIVSADPTSRPVTITAGQVTSGKLTLPSVADLVTGMHVTGALIQAGTTITAINPNASSITLSLPPTAAGGDTLSFPDGIGRTLTLTGSNTGANTLGNVLSNSAAGGALSLVKSGPGTWVLSTPETYTGTTRVNAGTLKLGVANAIAGATHSNLILNGGTFATGGFNQTMGTLQVLAKSTIDMGSPSSTLNLDNSNDSNPLLAWTPNKLLSIVNWDGNMSNPTLGGGTDKVLIGSGWFIVRAIESDQI